MTNESLTLCDNIVRDAENRQDEFEAIERTIDAIAASYECPRITRERAIAQELERQRAFYLDTLAAIEEQARTVLPKGFMPFRVKVA
jgi:hypothetical protein